jgi:hypothetical protein
VTAKAKKATAAAMTKEGRAGVWHLVKVRGGGCVVSVQVRGDWRRDLQDNWISGLSLSLVNLPLSISLGVAAATTPTRGVLGTVWCAPTLVSAALYACLPACLRARDS